MNKIHILEKLVQNQIAAGEVIERPYSVIKELVENSIDGNATDIQIDIENELLRVADNGTGMSKEDAILSVERYATSKITKSNDLFMIHSFGFRGEALASISAVSDFVLKTKRVNDIGGTSIRILGEELLETDIIGIPDGTIVEVRDLFFNTPARKKYLKSDQTEFGHIQKIIQSFAIAHPEISFTLTHSGGTNFETRSSDLSTRIRTILGNKLFSEFFSFQLDALEIKIHGYAIKPSHATSARKHQYIYINKRFVGSSIIHKAITEGYHRVTKDNISPSYVIFLELPPENIDINVHPRKAEVKFKDPDVVFKSVKNMIAETLAKEDVVKRVESIPSFQSTPLPRFSDYSPQSRSKSPYAMPRQLHVQNTLIDHSSVAVLTEKNPITLKYLGQLQNCYLLCENDQGLVLIDQHAAHERIRFENLRNNESETLSQQLLSAEIIELSLNEKNLLIEHSEDIKASGFAFEEVGDGNIILTSVPSIIVKNQGADIECLFLDILHGFEHLSENCSGSCNEITNYREKLWAYTACRGAIQFGDPLSDTEAKELLIDFEQCTNKHTCPHGRTSMINVDMHSLKSFFDR